MNIGPNQNLSSLRIISSINLASMAMNKASAKVSSGWKINFAADDPAGLVISEAMRARIAGLNQEIENTSITMDKYSTADSALLQMRSNLTEMRTLALAAGDSGVIDDSMRGAYQAEADNLTVNYNRIATQASFGDQKLLDGSSGSVANLPPLTGFNLSSSAEAQESLKAIDEEIARVDAAIGQVGATEKYGLESRLNSLRIEMQNLTAAESQIRDTDYASVFADFLKNKLILHSAVSLLSHQDISARTVLNLLNSE
ncbi:putative Flagellin domain protein [Candidatus Zixiibacteriota bacterium]|nr:putative Flagellin domain protein [candidate division Zixibacteria bacterium]